MASIYSNRDHSYKDYPDGSKNSVISTPKEYVPKPDKIAQNRGAGTRPEHKGPATTTTKQSMHYFVVKYIEQEIGYLEQDWPKFALKELIENAYDWLNDHYSSVDEEVRKIGIRIWMTIDGNNKKFIHIAVRNSNVNEIPVFLNLNDLFDYKVWASTKRNQNRMTCGALGDALKRILGM